MTEACTETPEETLQQDAAFLELMIDDNGSWNRKGISDEDLQVLFEYSHLCNWGGFPLKTNTFSVKRFRAALDAMRPTKVQKVGDHWYTADKAPDAKQVTSQPTRAAVARKPRKTTTTPPRTKRLNPNRLSLSSNGRNTK